jgi:hypothetical protein
VTMELALSLPSAMLYPDWIATGRALANSKRNIDWLIGDWLSFGRTHFPEQIEMALADLGEDPNASSASSAPRHLPAPPAPAQP